MERYEHGMDRWDFNAPEPIRLQDLPLVPISEVPTDAFSCAMCGATLWMAGQMAVLHDCSTGEVVPA